MDIFGVVFVEQSPALGTGHAVQCCLNHIGMNDRILILNGDMPLIRPNILHILIKNGRMNMVMTTKLDNPTGYGRVIYDSRGEFRAIKEERDCEEDDRQIQEVNTGVYIFSGQVLHECLPLLTNDNSQKEYYLTDVVRHALTAGYIIHTFMTMDSISVLGANTPEELAELSRILESRS
jgi:bifunctional UDP-N-acetylglucosamine pyrophosphorylase/glucosamine-1-phosphate N-acetyltransferase